MSAPGRGRVLSTTTLALSPTSGMVPRQLRCFFVSRQAAGSRVHRRFPFRSGRAGLVRPSFRPVAARGHDVLHHGCRSLGFGAEGEGAAADDSGLAQPADRVPPPSRVRAMRNWTPRGLSGGGVSSDNSAPSTIP